MAYPKAFYYTETQSGIQYQQRATGKPNITRLIRGHADYWFSPSIPHEKKKKKLILADWSAESWSDEKISQTRAALEQLIDEGFEVYLWQGEHTGGQLKPLAKGGLKCLKDAAVRSRMIPHSLKEITLAGATQCRFTSDEIHVLDDYWVNYLLSEDDAFKPRSISLLDFCNSSKKEDVLNWLAQSSPPLSRILIDSYQGFIDRRGVDSLYKRFPDSVKMTRYCEVTLLQEKEISDLLKKRSISTADMTLRLSDLAAIESLRLAGKISQQLRTTSTNLQALLLASVGLKKLMLDNFVLSGALTLAPGSLPALHELIISDTALSLADLKKLLLAASHLQVLDLSSHTNLSSPVPMMPGSLPQLEVIKSQFGTINNAVLKSLLLAAINLKKLDLLACTYLTDPITLVPGSLARLQEINLSQAKITSSNIKMLLQAAPNIQTLDLSGCDYLRAFSIEPNSLLQLETVKLKSVYPEYIIKIVLLAAPNLKKIDMSWSNPHDLALEPNSLTQLEELNLTSSDITIKDLLVLLDAAPNLKIINLMSCGKIPVEIQKAAADKAITSIRLRELLASAAETEVVIDRLAAKMASTAGNKSEGEASAEGSDSVQQLFGNTDTMLDEDYEHEEEHLSEKLTSAEGSNPVQKPFGSTPMDADTTPDPNKTFHVRRVFYPIGHTLLPPVNHYRIDIFQTAHLNPSVCSVNNAFALKKMDDLGLKPCVIVKSAHETEVATAGGQLFYGGQTLDLTTQWQALASLSPQDEIRRYNTTPEVEVEIQYSTRDNLYYIRSTKAQTVDIDFTVYVPDAKPTLPKDIQVLVNDFLSYESAALDITMSNPTGDDYLNAILHQKKGACRHRAFAFKKEMERLHPEIAVRIVTNECHAFVEMQINNQWLSCDLGGYPAKLEIDEGHKPNRAPHEALETHIVLPSPTLLVPVVPVSEPSVSAVDEFKDVLQTWVKATSLTGTTQEYAQTCVSSPIKKRLIECSSTDEVDALHYALQSYCQATKRPVFYVNSPADLICAAPSMQRREDNSGELRPGPSGPLHEFLTTHTNGVLIVNYDAFKADDLVRFNALVDKERRADGTDVPTDTIILGLLNTDSENPTPGSDFYSRFDRVETCPLSSRQLKAAMPSLPPHTIVPLSTDVDAHYSVINLYHAEDWESILMGRWVPQAGAWHYEEGALQQALAKGITTLELQNGLWENKDFRRFWREARQSGVIHYSGGTLTLPEGFNVVQREGYDWALFAPFIEQETHLSEIPYLVLNPATQGEFFSHYRVTEDKQLERLDGFIRAAKDKDPACLAVHVTHPISEDQWAMLLNECQIQRVKLTVYCAPGVELPKPLQGAGHEKKSAAEPIAGLPDRGLSTAIIQSTDVDTTVAQLLATEPHPLVLDISECHDIDLIAKIHGELINREGEPLRFQFEQIQCAVTHALAKGQPVILKGRCSLALAQELAPLLLEHPNIKIVSEDTAAFHYMPRYVHTVSKEEKLACLQDYAAVIKDIEDYLEKEPLSTLISRCRFIQAARGVSSDHAWVGLRYLPASTKEPGIFDEATAAAATVAFTQRRIEAVNTVLTHEPYVFLTGLSGVGKSTFVTKELCQATDTLYQGESALIAWATDTAPGKRKLLFLDEANLSQSEWSAFEGLFNQPPGILINGHYYPITDEHKVIFAANPLSYGDERTLAPFFARHGNAVLFEPLPSAVLYEQVLKPVFNDTFLQEKAESISAHLLDVYRFLCLCSDTDILISPRELQMMALLTVSYCSRSETLAEAEDVAQYFAYHLAKHLVPAEKQVEFINLFKPTLTLAPARTPHEADYVITPSRQHVNQLLDECLNLRELRDKSSNEAQRYGGLGGLILDGDPGIGKSDLVLTALRARGYEEVRHLTEPALVEKPFYRMPVSMALAEKEALLLKAFHEGAIVIIDEINSSPMMERLLNALLMGSTPDGQRPEKPGFMVIGTQNPITMAGRRAPSTALSRRMITVELLPYTAAEMKDILLSKGLPLHTVRSLVKAYQEQVAYAKKHQVEPSPTFRDVLNLAEDIKRGHELKAKRVQTLATSSESYVGPEPVRAEDTPPIVEDAMDGLISKYFGSDSEDLGGAFSDYFNERARTYQFKDLCEQYAAFLFQCFGYKTEKAIREELIATLHTQIIAYHNDPIPETRSALWETMSYCKHVFKPRAPIGTPGYEKSLHAYLSRFEQEIKQITHEEIPSSARSKA